MTVKDFLRNHDKDDHIYVIYIYQHNFRNCLYDSHSFKVPKCISERELVKWSIVEGSDAWIYLNIKVKWFQNLELKLGNDLMCFKFYQPNNKQEIAYDCVIRALSKVFNKSWLEVFDELVKIARNLQVVPNEDKCFNEYLKAYPLKKIKKQKPTIKEFSSTHKGTYIVKSSGHLVAIENGNYFDCWDSGNLKIYKFWLIKIW